MKKHVSKSTAVQPVGNSDAPAQPQPVTLATQQEPNPPSTEIPRPPFLKKKPVRMGDLPVGQGVANGSPIPAATPKTLTLDVEAEVIAAESVSTPVQVIPKWQAPMPLELSELKSANPLPVSLSADEQKKLAECEVIIAAGIVKFYDVGTALKAVKEGRLFRDKYSSFDDYCKAKWGFCSKQAYRYVGASEVVADLSPLGDKLPNPLLERHVRPLVPLSSQDRKRVVTKLIGLVGDGKCSAKLINLAVASTALASKPAATATTTTVAATETPMPLTVADLTRGIQRVLDFHDELSKAIHANNSERAIELVEMLGDKLRALIATPATVPPVAETQAAEATPAPDKPAGKKPALPPAKARLSSRAARTKTPEAATPETAAA